MKAVVQTTGACVKLVVHVTLLGQIKTFEGVKDCEDSVRGLCGAEETNIMLFAECGLPSQDCVGFVYFGKGQVSSSNKQKKTPPKDPPESQEWTRFFESWNKDPKTK